MKSRRALICGVGAGLATIVCVVMNHGMPAWAAWPCYYGAFLVIDRVLKADD